MAYRLRLAMCEFAAKGRRLTDRLTEVTRNAPLPKKKRLDALIRSLSHGTIDHSGSTCAFHSVSAGVRRAIQDSLKSISMI
jgi:hypothetical protein